MGLTSPALAFLLGAAVAVLLGAVLLGWRRLAGRRAWQVALRAAALCALQASVLSLVFVMVNRSLVFYSSWSDLLGSDTAGGTVLAVQDGSAGSAAPVQVLTRSAVAVPGVPGAGGHLEGIRIHGALSGLTVSGHLYLPAAYSRAANHARRYPVIVVITNQQLNGSSPYAPRRLAEATAAQIAGGRLGPVMLLVLPASLGRSDQGCLNVPGGIQAQALFAQDVPRALETTFRTSTAADHWALLGDQSGGYCSLQLALNDSAVFSVAAVPRASYTQLPGSSEAGGSWQIRRQDNLIWQLRHQPPPPLSVLFAGPGDFTGLGQARQFASLARRPLRVTSAGLGTGRWPLAPVLDWIGGALKVPAAPGGAGGTSR